MIRNARLRRSLAVLLVLLGGVLMFLAPPVWTGLIVLGLGVLLEAIGIALEHRSQD